MVNSTASCLKELKEDPKSSTWFKDCTGVFKELMGKDWEIQEVIKNTSTGQSIVLIQGDISFRELKFSNISYKHSLSLIFIFFLVQKVACKSMARITFQALINIYSSEQQVAFEGKTWASTLDIDRQDTELESKVFWSVLFSQFRLSYVPQSSNSTTNDLQEFTSNLLTDSALNSAFPSLATLYIASLQLAHIASYKNDSWV